MSTAHTINKKDGLGPTCWLHVQRNDSIGYQSLAVGTVLVPLLFAAPFFYFAGARLGWFVLATLTASALFVAGGVMLKSARAGMLSYQEDLEGAPTGVSVTAWHRYLYEHPVAEYFVFRVGSRALMLGWALTLAGACAVLATPFFAVVGLSGEWGLVSIFIFLFFMRGVVGQWIAFLLIVGTGVAAWFRIPDLVTCCLLAWSPMLVGFFTKHRGDRRLDGGGEGEGGEGNEVALVGPAFTYFVVEEGWLADRFVEGGMYRRAKSAIAVATVKDMMARGDADEYQAVAGQVHRGGKLSATDLAAALAAMGSDHA